MDKIQRKEIVSEYSLPLSILCRLKQWHFIFGMLYFCVVRYNLCVCVFFRTLFAQYLAQKMEKLEVKSGHSKNPTYLQNGERYIS